MCIFCNELHEIADLKRPLIGTCTMAIVMLAAFYPEQLPGVPPATMFGLTDVASYSDAWNAVKRVKNNCISEYLATNETIHESGGGMNFRSLTGWSATGTLHLLRTLGESVADVKYVLQEAKALLVSFYGTQIRK